ncbi:cadmium-translocating P-type ATPase [Ruminococcus sp. OA3]|uniref:heavy metal translocating P-type ATPase n=1 Tax=Ruminococcus sp. OA3 TaxID=2914164 RepID=UPI001F055C6D|nr:heavy metal translocating P-type ATPase [Ruminococcus sp. OA3]MCH1982331.1 cadmium-translocating P-type ATPase [Ruminococcus sp. OA3]
MKRMEDLPEHQHKETCGCGHDHHEHQHEACGCGHEHHDHHEHQHEACGCGHEHHDHQEHHHEACGCGHDHHEHTPHSSNTVELPDDGHEKRVYILENLGCANCAAKMEQKIQELPGVFAASITFATKQLRISADSQAALVPQIQSICSSIESEVRVIPKDTSSAGSSKTKTYILQNLGCANCAAKMEQRINQIADVENATITFATKQLKLTAKSPQRLIPEIKKICNSIEDGIEIVEKETSVRSHEAVAAKKGMSESTRALTEIIIGAVLFIAGEILEHMGFGTAVTLPVYVVAYVVLGWKVIWTALRNITRGQVFDENFLMSIATLGAFVIREYPEAVGVMLFYRVGEFFEEKAVAKSRSQIMDAVDLRPETVNLVSNEDVQIIPSEEARIGDILLVRPGDRIPLDGIVIEGNSQLDTSPITGEPVPVKTGIGDSVLSGCVNTSGQLKIRVEKELSESMVTRILDSVENAAASKPVIDRFITRFARIYTPFVVALAIVTAVLPSLITGDWQHWIYTALTFLVMSCPCALVLSVPLAFFSGIGAGSKKGILFKGGISIEALKGVRAVIMDKTGTITQGNFVVQETVPSGLITRDELLTLAAGCEQSSTHPIAVSIVNAAKARNLTLSKPEALQEIAGHGIKAKINGKEVLCGNSKLMEAQHVDLSSYHPSSFGTEVLVAIDGIFSGHLMISDTIKEDAKSSIAALKKLGLTTIMLTGDAQESAESVAEQTGIDEVHAKLLPQDKLDRLNDLRSKYGSVMFVGDGINDAPVLAGANVGAAMGSGADAAIEAADVVYMTSGMEAIPQSVQIARSTSRISWQNVIFALIIKGIVMVLGLCGFASMWLAVFADTGVAFLCILNSIRILYKRI